MTYMIRRLSKPMKGYKKVRLPDLKKVAIVTLLIPKGALVAGYWHKDWQGKGFTLSSFEKCRASSAKVLGVYTVAWHHAFPVGIKTEPLSMENTGYRSVQYTKGKLVKPHNFARTFDQCAGGIHFFKKRSQAEQYFP